MVKKRNRYETPETKRRWNLLSRYGITPYEYDALMEKQGGKCAICDEPPKRPVVDHCHKTNAVRGILCHACNIKLPAIDDEIFLARALAYVKATK